MLALLAVHRGPCPQDRLIDDLWGDDPPSGARKTLQTYVWRLRNLLPEGAITSTAGGYQLHTTDESDFVRFEHLIGEAAGALNVGEARRAAELSRDALELWRGEPFGGCALVDALQARRTWLEELHSQAVEGHLDAELRLGHHNDLIGELEHHVQTAPLRERLWEMLALALYRSGRQAEALRACRRARDRLIDELGISPSVALIELEQRILAQDPTLVWTPPHSDERTVDATTGNLPFRLPRLIGREVELRALVKEVVAGSAVTVVGPGGMGKTRLALQVAAEAVAGFRDGAWLVDLSGRGEPQDVVVALAEALGVPERSGISLRAAVGESVRRRQLLVVLDNCDHLIETAADVVEELLAVAPGLAMLSTSREPLGVSGERVRALGPLTAHDDGADDPAVELFVERAHDARPDLDVTAPLTRAAIVEICAHLDGMPLAIELAAGRCAAMHPAEIAARLGDRLKLLTGGRRTAAARHRTLAATIDWSYDLLDEPQRVLFRRLGVFTGSFSLDAAQTVGSDGLDVVDLLASLVAKSMVAVTGSRYRLLETLREYAVRRLDEAGERAVVEAAEAARCVALVGGVATGLKGPDEPDWADLLADELDNLRACWRRSVAAGDPGTALGCFAPLPEWNGLALHVTQELATWADPTVRLGGAAEHPLYVGACLLASRGRYNAWDLAGAEQWLDRAEAVGPVPARFAAVFFARRAVLAHLAGAHRDVSVHKARARASTDLASDPYEWAYVEGLDLFILSPVSSADASALSPKALAAARTAGSPYVVMFILTSMAELFLFYTRPARLDRCQELAEEALRVGARCRNPQFVNSAISKLAADGHHREALQMARDHLLADQRRGHRQQLWWHLRCLLVACQSRHLHLRYAQLFGAIYGGTITIGLEPTANELDGQAAARDALGPEPYDEATAASRRIRPDDLIQLALDVIDELLALADDPSPEPPAVTAVS